MTTTDHAHTDGTVLPPYSGEETACPKCSHSEARTVYRMALSGRQLRDWNDGAVQRGPLPERLERECMNCGFTWDESLCPPGCGMTVEALAHAIDNSTPYPVDLQPEVATYMARYLLECLRVAARPDHPLWQYDDGSPVHEHLCKLWHPTAEEKAECLRRRAPQPQTPPADMAEEDQTP